MSVERLTFWDKDNNQYAYDYETSVRDLINRLAAYEATGTPAQFAQLAQAGKGCDGCRFRDTDAWKYHVYPCSECARRSRDWYEAAVDKEPISTI